MGSLTQSASSIVDGRKVVATAGTREALLSTDTSATTVLLQAETDNTGVVVVGGNTVVAAQGTRRGFALSAGEFINIPIDQAQDLYLDVTVNGDGVTYILLS